MGDALVVMTVPEEAWIGCERDLAPNSPQATQRRRGTVSWRIEAGEVWAPPPEPTDQYGLRWYEHPEARRAHRKAVQQSLEAFLNERLAKLYHMLRTGWWVLGKARVRVVDCRPVPEREMRQLARSLHGAKSPIRRRRSRR
jgi:hypothetical protein